MTLLSIFDFGFGGLALLTVGLLGLAGFLLWQANKKHNSGWTQQGKLPPGQGIGDTSGSEKIPYTKIAAFWGGVIVIAVYIGILLWIRSDYAPAKQSTPVEQLNDGRESAEDQLKRQ